MALLVSNCLMIVTIAIIMLCNILSDCVNIPCCTWPNLNQEQSEALKFIYFFLMDCNFAPCTLFLACDIRQQCYQYILIVPRIDLRIQFTFAMVMLISYLPIFLAISLLMAVRCGYCVLKYLGILIAFILIGFSMCLLLVVNLQ